LHTLLFLSHPTPAHICPPPLHDALPISVGGPARFAGQRQVPPLAGRHPHPGRTHPRVNRNSKAAKPCPASPLFCWVRSVFGLGRSEEHTSELQSRFDLVCRLLLEKKIHQ